MTIENNFIEKLPAGDLSPIDAEEMQNRSDKLVDSLKKGAKVLGAAALGGALGYATSKGLEVVLPLSDSDEAILEGLAIGVFSATGVFVGAGAL